VALLDPKSGKPTRVGYRVDNGIKTRVAKKSGAVIEQSK
jgi:large subunit ribosomal protein L24